MFNKKITLILFAIIAIAQLGIISYMSIDSENILSNGKTIKVRLYAVDPVDPFRGRYINLNFNNTIENKSKEEWQYNEPCYGILEKDSTGFYEIKSVSKSEPTDESVYFKTYVRTVGGKENNKLSVHITFSRFYMEENKAQEIDKIMQDTDRDSLNSYIIMKYKDGELRVKDLVVEKIK